jgi:hypothetical protein
MHNLACVLSSLNRLNEAEELSREALNFRKANLLPNHPDIGKSIYKLASVLQRLNRLKESEDFFREAVNFSKANL